MILIADSGSTKTAWMEVESGNMIVTEGLNPHFTSDEQFLAVCSTVREKISIFNSPFSIFFYGAGCGNAVQRERVERLLSAAFCAAEVHVGTDMLGACRAVSGGRPSLVAILGTGSNACLFDGDAILCQPVSTGYVLGDQGSANHVGRILLNDYLTLRMPQDIRVMFHDDYPMSNDQFIETVYHHSSPNRFLASLAPFAVKHQADDYCHGVVVEALYDWRHGMLQALQDQCGVQDGELNVVGGFAKAAEAILREFMAADVLAVGTVVADPLEGLRQYHLQQ